MTVGEAMRRRIVQLCEEHDISFNKLGNISGVTQSTINNICLSTFTFMMPVFLMIWWE